MIEVVAVTIWFVLKAIIAIYLVLAFIEFSKNYHDDQRD